MKMQFSKLALKLAAIISALGSFGVLCASAPVNVVSAKMIRPGNYDKYELESYLEKVKYFTLKEKKDAKAKKDSAKTKEGIATADEEIKRAEKLLYKLEDLGKYDKYTLESCLDDVKYYILQDKKDAKAKKESAKTKEEIATADEKIKRAEALLYKLEEVGKHDKYTLESYLDDAKDYILQEKEGAKAKKDSAKTKEEIAIADEKIKRAEELLNESKGLKKSSFENKSNKSKESKE